MSKLPADSSPPNASQDADALLSELASGEIDRLLAEADIPKLDLTEPNPLDFTQQSMDQAVLDLALDGDDRLREIESPLEPEIVPRVEEHSAVPQTPELRAEPKPAIEESALPPAAPFADASPIGQASARRLPGVQELDALSAKIDSEHAVESPPPIETRADAAGEHVIDEDEEIVSIDPQEFEALHAPVDEVPPVEVAHATEAAMPAPAPIPATPIAPAATLTSPPARLLVGMLNLLNRPFAGLASSWREVLGSLAILTLANALGILLYLMLFRSSP